MAARYANPHSEYIEQTFDTVSGGKFCQADGVTERNVRGTALTPCGDDPITGFYRDSYCRVGPEDVGVHAVCAVMTREFLEHQVAVGNDLVTPRPQWQFPGLHPGDRWCVTAYVIWPRPRQDVRPVTDRRTLSQHHPMDVVGMVVIAISAFALLEVAAANLRGEERGSFYTYDQARERGIGGAGTVHHVAWASPQEEHEAWRQQVLEAGGFPTPVIDRFYFRSIYFREPSGVLFEIATVGPGFAVDEDPEHLGESLVLPPAFEPLRDQREPVLTPLPDPRARESVG